MKTMYFIWFGICFVCYMIRTIFNVLKYKKSPLAENKKIINSIYVVMFILWFSWGQMCFFDPLKFNIIDWIRYMGLLLVFIGVFLFIFSHINLKGFVDREKVVTGGIYSKIRNPMYLGFIIWIIGFPIFMQGFITLASSALWIIFIIYWKILEEKELEQKYKEYSEYKKRTWF